MVNSSPGEALEIEDWPTNVSPMKLRTEELDRKKFIDVDDAVEEEEEEKEEEEGEEEEDEEEEVVVGDEVGDEGTCPMSLI